MGQVLSVIDIGSGKEIKSFKSFISVISTGSGLFVLVFRVKNINFVKNYYGAPPPPGGLFVLTNRSTSYFSINFIAVSVKDLNLNLNLNFVIVIVFVLVEIVLANVRRLISIGRRFDEISLNKVSLLFSINLNLESFAKTTLTCNEIMTTYSLYKIIKASIKVSNNFAFEKNVRCYGRFHGTIIRLTFISFKIK